MADATKNVLPDAIRLRSDKRPFNEVFYLGLRRNLPALLAVLDTPALTELGMVDAHVVIDALRGRRPGGHVAVVIFVGDARPCACGLARESRAMASPADADDADGTGGRAAC